MWSGIHAFDKSGTEGCPSSQHLHGSQHLCHSNPLPLSSPALGLALSRAVAFSLVITHDSSLTPSFKQSNASCASPPWVPAPSCILGGGGGCVL